MPLALGADLFSQYPCSRDAEARKILAERFHREPTVKFGAFLVHYAATVVPIAITLAVCSIHPSVLTYALAAIVTGFAQNSLGVLMHEGAHHFFHPRRRVNDLLADVLVCWPIFNTVAGYRAPHFEHHRYSGSAGDPYLELYSGWASKRDLLLTLLRDASSLSAIAKFTSRVSAAASNRDRSSSPGTTLGLLAVQGIIFAIYAAATGRWWAYFVLWALPLMTFGQVLSRIRAAVEHMPRPGDPEVSRSTAPGWIEYLLVAPHGYSFHFEHHVAPSIPYYRLAAAHRSLCDRGFAFTDRELVSGYVTTFASLWLSLASPLERRTALTWDEGGGRAARMRRPLS